MIYTTLAIKTRQIKLAQKYKELLSSTLFLAYLPTLESAGESLCKTHRAIKIPSFLASGEQDTQPRRVLVVDHR